MGFSKKKKKKFLKKKLFIYMLFLPKKKKTLHIYLTIPSCIILMGRWIILQLYRETYINKNFSKKKSNKINIPSQASKKKKSIGFVGLDFVHPGPNIRNVFIPI